MGDAGVHFLFVLLVLYAARVHVKHHFLAPFFYSFLALLPDADHFFGLVVRGTLHNIFFTFLLPLAFVVFAFTREKKGVVLRESAVIVFLVLFSHSLFDAFYGGPLYYFYPFSDYSVSFSELDFNIASGDNVYTAISSESIGLLLFAAVVSAVFLLEEIIELHDAGLKKGRAFNILKRQFKELFRA
ncbi:metal-dependent hydrolase [Candidatus Micrarchaeota archaeon]|nr:metal-dependent hydrolase [Candidatus Micrarchaeota archaeon]